MALERTQSATLFTDAFNDYTFVYDARELLDRYILLLPGSTNSIILSERTLANVPSSVAEAFGAYLELVHHDSLKEAAEAFLAIRGDPPPRRASHLITRYLIDLEPLLRQAVLDGAGAEFT